MGGDNDDAVMAKTGIRQAQATCLVEGLVFESPYNEAASFGTKSAGFMFYLGTHESAVRIKALELDVLLNQAVDLSVEVFTTDEDYDDLFNTNYAQADLWTKVADTQLIPHPGGQRALIADKAFTDVLIAGGSSKKSFYVRMKGPWLDYTAFALTKGGEIASSNGQIRLFAGSPVQLDSEKEPDPENSFAQYKLGRSVSPILAGKAYYDLETLQCTPNGEAIVTTPIVETSMEFAILTDGLVTSQIYSDIERDVKAFVKRILVEDEVLKGFTNTAELQLGNPPGASFRVYNGVCPWIQCKTVVVNVFLKHEASLDPGEVKSEMYKHTESVVATVVSLLPENAASLNVGRKGAEANFQLTLQGIPTFPTPKVMDEVQLAFLEAYIVEFLSLTLPSSFAEVYSAKAESQKLVNSEDIFSLSTMSQMDSVLVTGKVFGAQFSQETAAQFAARVDNAFTAGRNKFIPGLEFNLNIPGEISDQGRSAYFERLFNITTSADTQTSGGGTGFDGPGNQPVAPDPQAPSNKDSEGSNSLVIGIVVAVTATMVIAGMIALWYYLRRRKEKTQTKPHDESSRGPDKAPKGIPRFVDSNRPNRGFLVRNQGRNARGPGTTDSTETMDVGSLFSEDRDLEKGQARSQLSSGQRGVGKQYQPATDAEEVATERVGAREQPQPSYAPQVLDTRPKCSLSALSQMGASQLQSITVAYNISYDPREARVREDLIRIIVESEKLNIVWDLPRVERGPMGPGAMRGRQGSMGPGVHGSQGSMGPGGMRGSQGSVGPVAMRGSQGSVGPVAMRGSQGSMGPGVHGSQGSVGLAAMRGSQGSTGPVAMRGSQGSMDLRMPSTPSRTGPVTMATHPKPKARKTRKTKKRGAGKRKESKRKAAEKVPAVSVHHAAAPQRRRVSINGSTQPALQTMPPPQARRVSLVAASGWSRQPNETQRQGSLNKSAQPANMAPIQSMPPPQARRVSLVAASGWSRQPAETQRQDSLNESAQPANMVPIQTMPPPQARRASLVAASGWSRQPAETQRRGSLNESAQPANMVPIQTMPPPQARRASLVAASGWSRQPAETQRRGSLNESAQPANMAPVQTMPPTQALRGSVVAASATQPPTSELNSSLSQASAMRGSLVAASGWERSAPSMGQYPPPAYETTHPVTTTRPTNGNILATSNNAAKSSQEVVHRHKGWF